MRELIEVVYRCNPDADGFGPVTWQAGPDVALSWQAWLDDVFRPALLPHLFQVAREAQVNGLREICQACQRLDGQLAAARRATSRAAGRRLLFHSPPRGDRVQLRYQAEVQAGRAPGHFASLFAVRAVGFAVPLRSAALAYALQELFAGGCSAAAAEHLVGSAARVVSTTWASAPGTFGKGASTHG